VFDPKRIPKRSPTFYRDLAATAMADLGSLRELRFWAHLASLVKGAGGTKTLGWPIWV
jgi:hypothetical protein